MIHPTRTNLLLLRDKNRSVVSSVKILKARRQALMREFLSSSSPFLKSRDRIRREYRKALQELHLSLGHEGREFIESVAAAGPEKAGAAIEKRNILGVKYLDVVVGESLVRSPDQRDYDFSATTPHLEEALHLFERIVDAMMEIAAYESKLRRLADEIVKVTRRTRVLEERVMPGLKHKIKTIVQYLSEREREAYFRLKRFKGLRTHRDLIVPYE